MNMYKASFDTEQNYITIIDNTTKKNPYENLVYFNNLICRKNENIFFHQQEFLLLRN